MKYPIYEYDAAEVASLVQRRELSAAEVCRAYLEAAETSENNEYITIDHDGALAAAESVDREVQHGASLPLAGVPLSVKDNICTAGLRTTCASEMLRDFIPQYDATAVERLRRAGAVIIGKTNMDEFAVGYDGGTSCFGPTVNPFDRSLTPGGSSSGSAASLAGGTSLLSLGSDTGGSARVPASFCGLPALKPTWGAVSRYGLVGMAPSLEQICPMGRSVRDVACAFGSIAGRDVRDMTSGTVTEFDVPKDSGRFAVKVGVFLPDSAADYTARIIDGCVAALCEAGAEAVPISLPHSGDCVGVYYIISSAEASSNLARFDGVRYGAFRGSVRQSRTEGFGSHLRERLAEGAYAVMSDGGRNLQSALNVRAELTEKIEQLFESVDIILTPACDTVAPQPGACPTAGELYAVYANLTGCPSLVTVGGTGDKGMPVGVQLMGRRASEKTVFRAAGIISNAVRARGAV
mgnify:CR=1 FL=1